MAAMLGTAAHKVIETMIDKNETDAEQYRGRVIVVVRDSGDAKILEEGDAAEVQDGNFMFVCDDAMVNGVQTMIDEIERVKSELFDSEIFSERYLDMTWLDSRLGGTADVTLVETAGWIHLFDYKNGRIVVEVKDNEQFLNYAVGLLHEHPECLGVHIHLVQPNAQHEEGIIRDAIYTADEVRLFEINLKAAADATTPPNAPLRAGDWCTYCPAKERCSAFDAMIANEAFIDFAADPPDALGVPELNPNEELDENSFSDAIAYRAELARRARFIPLLDQWSRDLHARIHAELISGNDVGDWKLVEGKSNRVWGQADDVTADVLAGKWAVPREMLFTEPKLKSPAQVEKLAKAVNRKPVLMKEIVASLAKRPPGRVVAVPGSDVRMAVDPATVAVQDFADDPVEDFTP